MVKKLLALDPSFRCCAPSKPGTWALFRPMDDNTVEWDQFTLRHHLRAPFAHETSINSERLPNQSLFSLLSHSHYGYSVQSYAIFWVTLLYTFISKNNTCISSSSIRHSVKKKALSPCLCLFCAWMKPWDDVKKWTRLIPLHCRPGAKKAPYFLTLKGYNIWRKNSGPKTFSLK